MISVPVSANFKKMATKSILSVVTFLFIYLILIIAAIAISAGCFYLCFFVLLKGNINIILTILLALGIGSFGGLLLYFFLKFIFIKEEIDRSHMLEISQEQEPQLFKLIHDVVEEVGTAFPKKVFISHEVNASVFYDSTFWSMFLPTAKNLHIGLGLMNSTSEQEFKGILAHEFGHFSQKSMRIGSYVYQVNKVIYNQLYDNQDYQNSIERFKNIHIIVYISVQLQEKIIQMTRWLLRKLYDVINLNYMALSREMEFHADAVSVHVAGKQHVKSALLRINLAQHSFSSAITMYNENFKGKYFSNNIFKEHRFILGFLSDVNNLTVRNQLPEVTEFDYNRYDKSKLNFSNQWDSHPSIINRIEAIEVLNVEKNQSGHPLAIDLLVNPTKTQELFSEILFDVEGDTEERLPLTFDHFQKEYVSAFKKVNFPKSYKGYYDNRNPEVFDIESVKSDGLEASFDDIFSDENIDRVYHYIALKNDIELLKQIASNEVEIKSFDYDGIKYPSKAGNELAQRLESELNDIEKALKEFDKTIYAFFLGEANKKGKEEALKQEYLNFFKQDKQFDLDHDFHKSVVDSIDFVSQETPFAKIEENFKAFTKQEVELKKHIQTMCAYKPLASDISPEIKEAFDLYASKEWKYFEENAYIDENLDVLYAAVNNYNHLLARRYFIDKNQLLEFQLTVL